MPDQALKITGLFDFPTCGTNNGEIKAYVYNFGKSPVDQFDITYSINGDTIDQRKPPTLPLIPAIRLIIHSQRALIYLIPEDITSTFLHTLDNGNPHANFGLTTALQVFGEIHSQTGQHTVHATDCLLTLHAILWRTVREISGWVPIRAERQNLIQLPESWTEFNSTQVVFQHNNVVTLFEDHEGMVWAGLDGEDGVAITYNGRHGLQTIMKMFMFSPCSRIITTICGSAHGVQRIEKMGKGNQYLDYL